MKNLRHLLLLLIQVTGTLSQQAQIRCHDVLSHCRQSNLSWISCYDEYITICKRGPASRRIIEDVDVKDFYHNDVDNTDDFEHESAAGYALYLPSEALSRSSRARVFHEVTVALTLFNSSLFNAQAGENETILGGRVLGVKVGRRTVRDLNSSVRISFIHTNETRGRCVYFEELEDGTGQWSTEGCNVSRTSKMFVCSCNHLSFFAVLVNPEALTSVDPVNVVSLSYINYIGCGLSVFFTAITLLMHLCLRNFRKGRSDQSMTVHLNLTAALFCLHLFFLLSVAWPLLGPGRGLGLGLDKGVGLVVCQVLGLLLHYSLLATFTWMALEGFHLYLLLVRVFNIYVRRYLLKLALVGWGVPMVTVIACAATANYGKFCLQRKREGGLRPVPATEICWITKPYVSYITVTGYLGLVFLFGAVMLCVMVAKLRKVRTRSACHQEYKRRLGRDCLTILGMGCVLGVPWGLAFLTYGPLSLPGLYLFTIVNGLQGVFIFLWFLALTWQPYKDEGSAGKDPSTQRMETSFNN